MKWPWIGKRFWRAGCLIILIGGTPAAMVLAATIRGSAPLPNIDGMVCEPSRWEMEAKDNRLYVSFSPPHGGLKASRPSATEPATVLLTQGDCAYEITVVQRRKRDSDMRAIPGIEPPKAQ